VSVILGAGDDCLASGVGGGNNSAIYQSRVFVNGGSGTRSAGATRSNSSDQIATATTINDPATITGTGTSNSAQLTSASTSITKVESVRRLSREILAMARDAGADCLATACPLCQSNLDLRQREIEAEFGERLRLPIFYFTQLLGLALGLSPAEVGLRSMIQDPWPCLTRTGVFPGPVGSGSASR
jgi:hypothetical protein